MKTKEQVEAKLISLCNELDELYEERDKYIREQWHGDHSEIVECKIDSCLRDIAALEWVLSA